MAAVEVLWRVLGVQGGTVGSAHVGSNAHMPRRQNSRQPLCQAQAKRISVRNAKDCLKSKRSAHW